VAIAARAADGAVAVAGERVSGEEAIDD